MLITKNMFLYTVTLSLACGAVSSVARADLILKPNNPAFGELDGKKGAFTARPQVAAARMGVWGFDANLEAAVKAEAAELDFLTTCQAKSGATTWPENCSPQGMALALTAKYGPKQNWVLAKFDSLQQSTAVAQQVAGMRYYKTPIVLPLYGHADHFGTVRQFTVTDDYKIVKNVRLFDGGDVIDINDPQLDGEEMQYYNGIQILNGQVYADTWWKVLTATMLSPADPNVNKFIFLYEPPAAAKSMPASSIQLAPGSPLVDDGEMNAELASMIVWDALDDQDLLTDRELPRLSDAVAGDGREVRGTTAAGRPWHYFVVPLYDETMRTMVAAVSLSAVDGSFQQMQYFERPPSVQLTDDSEALAAARLQLRAGERLSGGDLVWDPACGADFCRNPLLPYYEFSAKGRDGSTARIVVRINQKAARRG